MEKKKNSKESDELKKLRACGPQTRCRQIQKLRYSL